ncbi:thioredoxin domain-containing protein [Occultella gossypii]|uniref:Thioredoxin domain-containing protein n=1 Tax=Occultella gossypii TaxID=2800820 RepID=A0ABS7SHV4_9MICO|nr:thioredoxin domain-containing protein [Occultella gossypii]MBZ2199360.1 thioredoxin domain-containing protein [Occultella gossypii]
MANRLAASTSPYLRQHADNPVHWQEWGPEALAQARERDVPILLSVGYAACHWCHVMAHESFEDDAVAAAINEHFVAIKVDREERPDIDAVYMRATQAMTGAGGWPMTCFLTPAGEPFHCGTYYPRPQFLQLLQAVTEVWRDNRSAVVDGGAKIADDLRALADVGAPMPIEESQLADAVAHLRLDFDPRRAGFGSAPKFPPSMVLEFLLRHAARTGSERALAMVEATCTAMARGGIYDQLAGGFARYSVDAAWVVPHFEKMLYDNAQLLRVYLHLFRATGSEQARRVASETAEFLLRDLGTAEGGFASALDADTDGEEGLTYVWSPAEVEQVLGPDGVAAAELLGVTAEGTFEAGRSTLRLLGEPPEQWPAWRSALLAARSARPQPARDDKVVTSWNGLAIAALAEAGALLERPEWVAAASRCADFLLAVHVVPGEPDAASAGAADPADPAAPTAGSRLLRTSRDGVAGLAAGVADDYGNLAEGLLALHQATGERRWLDAADALLATALTHFTDGAGGFFDTADDAEPLVIRPRGLGDNAEPSGTSALAGALLTFSALTGRWRAEADAAIAAGGEVARRDARFAGWTLAVAEAAAAGPVQVAVVGTDDVAAEMVRLARAGTSPGLVLAYGPPEVSGGQPADGSAAPAAGSAPRPHPLLADRPLLRGGSAAYVCRGFVCDLPVGTTADLRDALEASTAVGP